jgi:DnaJ-class molecular chaperone
VKRDAKVDEIKRAYRKLAKQYHPDRNPGNAAAEAKFKEVQEAYTTLVDPEKRAQYDQFGAAGVGRWQTTPQGQRVYQWGGGSSVRVEDLEDLFSAFGGGGGHASVFDQFFGGGGRRHGRAAPRPQRPPDEERTVTLTFDQAIHGTSLSLQLTSGVDRKVQTLEVKIPPGVEEGQKIRVRGRVPGVQGGPAGDLILRCSIQPHPYFTRKGADVYVDVPVSVAEAALGAKIEVPAVDGRAVVTIPPGTQGGAKLRLAGRGVKVAGKNERGDQYVVIRIATPKTLTDEQRRLYEELRNADDQDPREQCAWSAEASA